MIYIELLLSFLKIGLFSFGGAYGAIPLIQDVVIANNWADAEMFANLVALSESTPGPIMVNMATYIGSRQAGGLGAVLATVGVVFPSFVVILIITILFQNILKRTYVQAVLKGVKPCLMGVILATGTYMAFSICINSSSIDLAACAIFLLLAAAIFLYRKFRKKELSPISLIIFAAVCGCLFY
ncbi:MAG: chromate transporter [Lachnospiraceae bacterium]|nr:chromate transporter [Lachnospiraceae bacterium]